MEEEEEKQILQAYKTYSPYALFRSKFTSYSDERQKQEDIANLQKQNIILTDIQYVLSFDKKEQNTYHFKIENKFPKQQRHDFSLMVTNKYGIGVKKIKTSSTKVEIQFQSETLLKEQKYILNAQLQSSILKCKINLSNVVQFEYHNEGQEQ
ncbi:hypothetical protein pb186bvf_016767 [Paramecium bursaria]